MNAKDGVLQAFEWFVPIVKSEPIGDDGRGPIRVYGVFTDESADLENDIVKAATNPNAFQCARHGQMRFNYNHRNKIVGDVHAVRFLTNAAAQRKYGHFGKTFKGIVGEVEGIVHPLTEEASEDLKDVRHLLKCQREVGTAVGFSLQGKARTQSHPTQPGYRLAYPTFVPLISIAPVPKNMNTVCLAKGIDLSQMEDQSILELDSGPGEMDGNGDLPAILWVAKAMDVSGIKADGGVTGGDSLKLESSGSGVVNAVRDGGHLRSCARCGVPLDHKHKHCHQCGERYQSSAELLRTIAGAANARTRCECRS
jgi:hypothetical protein